MMMFNKGLLIVGACALTASAPAAATDNPFAKDQAVLRLGGLDLTTVEGQQRLAIRMDEAARAVCGDRLSSVHLALGERARECRTEVIADIRAQIEARSALAANSTQARLASSH
jgi:UrcA family protein